MERNGHGSCPSGQTYAFPPRHGNTTLPNAPNLSRLETLYTSGAGLSLGLSVANRLRACTHEARRAWRVSCHILFSFHHLYNPFGTDPIRKRPHSSALPGLGQTSWACTPEPEPEMGSAEAISADTDTGAGANGGAAAPGAATAMPQHRDRHKKRQW